MLSTSIPNSPSSSMRTTSGRRYRPDSGIQDWAFLWLLLHSGVATAFRATKVIDPGREPKTGDENFGIRKRKRCECQMYNDHNSFCA